MADGGQAREEKAAAFVWARLEGAAERAKPALSHAQIVRAALEIADAEGIEALSMRKAAKRLGAGTMSLYRYVATRDELIDLMTDAVIGEVELPVQPPGDWRAGLAALARGTRRMVQRHPWAVWYLTRPGFGPNFRAQVEYALAAVDVLGLDIDRMLDMVGTVQAFAIGFVQSELAQDEAMRRTSLTEDEWKERMGPFVERVLATGDYPYLERVVRDADDHPDTDAAFERRLGHVLDGLEAGLEG